MQNNDPWVGRDDSAELGDTTRMYQIVRTYTDDVKNDKVLLGFASDAGVKRNHGRPGADQAPFYIRKMLANYAAHSIESLYDAGDVYCSGDDLERAQADLSEKISQVLDADNSLVVLGGGHEIAWGSFKGLYKHLLNKYGNDIGSILIVNIDAHFDLRSSPTPSSGTPFNQILEFSKKNNLKTQYAVFGIAKVSNTASLYEQASRFNVFYKEDCEMQVSDQAERLAELEQLICKADHIYLTIDMDCLPGNLAPGVSAPSTLGVPLTLIESFIKKIKASNKLRIADIAEVCPKHDEDNRTVKIAARIAWDMLI